MLATLVGSLLSLPFASRISTLFTSGIVAAPPDPTFAIAVLAGTAFWVGLATATSLPVSTTHAIVGALIRGRAAAGTGQRQMALSGD